MAQFRRSWLGLLLVGLALSSLAQIPSYRYFRVGNEEDGSATPGPGYALMGGGKDLDDAFRWLCVRAGGGDFLIMRAAGADDYNRYVQSLCRLNSVATIVIPNRAAALDPVVEKRIRNA